MKRHGYLTSIPLVILCLVLFSPSVPAAPDDAGFADDAKVDKAKRKAAIEKGVQYLKGKQGADGSWTPDGAPQTSHYQEGYTALSIFALLKCGVKRNDPVILKGMKYIKEQPFKSVYSVSCLILALDSFYTPQLDPEDPDDKEKLSTEPYEKIVKKGWQKANPGDFKLLKEALDWIISKQEKNIWRYPNSANLPRPADDTADEDASNTQYAMLALNVGLRLGLVRNPAVFFKVIEYFLKEQDKDGPDFTPPFRVPGADLDIKLLKKLRKELMKNAKKRIREAKKEKKEFDPGTTTLDKDPYPEYGPEDIKMKARGWSYVARGKGQGHSCKTTGSMTTSGVAALMICKSAVEGHPQWRAYKDKVNQSIRDGAAWLAANWSVSQNPNLGGSHYYYYLYGLERAGVLSLCLSFGKHNWYEEGANAILARQNADGSWGGASTGDGTVADTSFALLFLKKATTPIVKMPEQALTGGDILGGGKDKEKDK